MMNNDLISRAALLEEKTVMWDAALGHEECVLVEDIEKAPAVDAEPVRHGYWIPQDNTYTKFMCSDCKGRNHDGSGKYCSECGCIMDGEVNNDGSNSAEY